MCPTNDPNVRTPADISLFQMREAAKAWRKHAGRYEPMDLHDKIDDLINEVERLRMWIARLDNINDSPAVFNKEIDEACRDALEGKAMTGRISWNVWQRIHETAEEQVKRERAELEKNFVEQPYKPGG